MNCVLYFQAPGNNNVNNVAFLGLPFLFFLSTFPIITVDIRFMWLQCCSFNCLCTENIRVVKFGIQIESDWPQMGQMWTFKRPESVHFGSPSQKVLKLILKRPRFVPSVANLTIFVCQIWHPWITLASLPTAVPDRVNISQWTSVELLIS